MSYEFYKVLHLAAVITIFLTLGVLAQVPQERRKPWIILNGVSLLLAVVAGFGLLARLGHMSSIPTWAYLKLAMWPILGVLPTFFRKAPERKSLLLVTALLLGAAAAGLAIFKPGAAQTNSAATPAAAIVVPQ